MTFDFTHTTLGQRVVFGTGQVAAAVAAEVERLGAERVMVIVSGSAADKVTDFTDHFPVALWHREVVMHVPAEVADRAVAAAEVGDIDLVVSVGGGSATGLAKAVALQTRIPVIAVPTSVGYGANLGGLAALLGMLNSCAAGVSVVNIDNGFGAAIQASLINRLATEDHSNHAR